VDCTDAYGSTHVVWLCPEHYRAHLGLHPAWHYILGCPWNKTVGFSQDFFWKAAISSELDVFFHVLYVMSMFQIGRPFDCGKVFSHCNISILLWE
jgi:hypothetical protein